MDLKVEIRYPLLCALLFFVSSRIVASAADNSPDTIAKYLAGLTVPAAAADATVDAGSVADSPRRALDPQPLSASTPQPQPSNSPRPGSLIPNHAFPSALSPSQPLNPSTNARPASDQPSNTNPWLVHASDLDRAFKHTEQTQLAAIANWAPENLGRAYQSTGTMFYMFSGPDFLYAHAFFPNARTYILCGNEPVGAIPDLTGLSPNELPITLANIRHSLESVLSWSFFITKNMKTDLTQRHLSGTLPLLYVFLARSNCTIDSVTPVTIDNNGVVSEGGGNASDTKGATPGVRIMFRNLNSQLPASSSTLYYFCTDLSDDGIKSTPGLLRFCEQQGRGVSLLKAASYLMHEPGFSKIREFLLGNSETILQDDSGIPFRYFFQNASPASAWTIKLYGPYLGPIDVFKKYWQQDLTNEYARAPGQPLPFGFGYQWIATKSSVIVATRK